MREQEFEAMMQEKTGNQNYTLDGKPRQKTMKSDEIEEEMKIEQPVRVNQESG